MAVRLKRSSIDRQAIVLVATSGAYASKPRPWVVIQDDAYSKTDSIILCPFTHVIVENARLLRIDVLPSVQNGLRIRCQLQVEKIVTVPRRDVDRVVGRLEDAIMRILDESIRRVIGL